MISIKTPLFPMPILWRYMLSHHFRVFGLAVTSFVVILLTLRLDEIAHFISLGATPKILASFILLQIPYILPVALPVSSLIASLLLVQRLSTHHELTALRSSSLSLTKIFLPILLSSLLFSLLNFTIVSEIATTSHRINNQWKRELRSVNPLLLLHNKHLLRLKGMYYRALGPTHLGESAHDVLFAMPDPDRERLRLLVAKEIRRTEENFVGEHVTLIASLPEKKGTHHDAFWLENMQKIITPLDALSPFFDQKAVTLREDYLSLPLLWLWGKEAHKKVREENDPTLKKKAKHQWSRACSELARRISVAIAVLSFTLLGIAFGIHITRKRNWEGVFIVLLLAAFYLVSYFSAKNFASNVWLASTLYLAPHLILVSASLWNLHRIRQGKAS